MLVETVSTMHPDLLTWILDFEYGEVYPRECPGLTSTDRELAAIGCLATASSLEELRCFPMPMMHTIFEVAAMQLQLAHRICGHTGSDPGCHLLNPRP